MNHCALIFLLSTHAKPSAQFRGYNKTGAASTGLESSSPGGFREISSSLPYPINFLCQSKVHQEQWQVFQLTFFLKNQHTPIRPSHIAVLIPTLIRYEECQICRTDEGTKSFTYPNNASQTLSYHGTQKTTISEWHTRVKEHIWRWTLWGVLMPQREPVSQYTCNPLCILFGKLWSKNLIVKYFISYSEITEVLVLASPSTQHFWWN